jgi:uncharacterized protein (TIGR00730 family)
MKNDKMKRNFELHDEVHKNRFRVSIFGSARIKPNNKYYKEVVDLAYMLGDAGIDVVSGGGPGIMEAANKGAFKAGGLSMGLNISIPFEQFVNKYVTPDLSFEFHYFFMRKFWFAYLAKALIVFPGGFGTMDEFFEILTLVQTGKIKKNLKLVVYDEKYWKSVINLESLYQNGMINREDTDLFTFCNTVDEAFNLITKHFEDNYLNNGNSNGLKATEPKVALQ